jgi:hypothetical protein
LKTPEIIDSTNLGAKIPDSPIGISTKRFTSPQAEKQRKAIVLNKARRMGKSIPKPKSMGGA